MLRIIPNVCAQCKTESQTDSLSGQITLSIKNKIGSTITNLKTTIHWCSIHCAFEWLSGEFIGIVEESNEKVKIHPDLEAMKQILQDANAPTPQPSGESP